MSPSPAPGRLATIRRHPVKSMAGELLDEATLTDRGLLGDRVYALLDIETGKVASAKNPRRWPGLLAFRSTFLAPIEPASPLPPVRIDLPDGSAVRSDQPDTNALLSTAVGRPVRLAHNAPPGATAEGYWPDHDWLPDRDQTFEFTLPPGTFFDGATLHLITTASLRALEALAPSSRFDLARFRPNLLIDTPDAPPSFIESTWLGRSFELGEARIRIDRPCPRCVMTTVAQPGLPHDPNVLRTAVRNAEGNVGVYATILRPGRIRLGDTLHPLD